MNEHPHIEQLERLAQRADTLPPHERQRLAAHVSTCAFCHDILMEIQDFSRAMREVPEDDLRRETDRIVRLAMAPSPAPESHQHVFVLHRHDEPAQAPATRGYALAAKSESARAGYHPIATLYSDDGRTLLRILHEREHATYFFQLMSEFMERVPYALLVAPGREPMMTDAEGAFRISDADIDIVQIASMSMYFALDRLQSGPLTLRDIQGHDGVILASDESTVQLTGAGNNTWLRLRWHGPEESTPRYTGIVTSAGRAAVTVTDGLAVLPDTVFPLGEQAVDGTILLY